jgi:hypothetical protein
MARNGGRGREGAGEKILRPAQTLNISPDSSVSKVTGLMLNDIDLIFFRGNDFSLHKYFETGSGLHTMIYIMGTGDKTTEA